MTANGPPMFSFLLPDGQYVGRRHHNTPWQPSPPGDARCYSREDAEKLLPFFRSIFPDCTIAPAPRWNPNTRQYEIQTP